MARDDIGHEEKRDAMLARLTSRTNTDKEQERYERAQGLIIELKRINEGESTAAWTMGQYLNRLKEEDLWQVQADSWQEFIDGLGLTHPTEHMRRTNYQLYIEELGMEMNDPRLLNAGDSKLNLGTKANFRDWVVKNLREAEKKREPYLKKLEKLWGRYQKAKKNEEVELAAEIEQQIRSVRDEMDHEAQDFIDLCQPVDEGGLSRADLRRYLEEEVGITERDEKSHLGQLFKTLRKAREQWHDMTNDEWVVLMTELVEDEDLHEWLQSMFSAWQKVAKDLGTPHVEHTDLPEEVLN